MGRKKKEVAEDLSGKFEYLGLDLNNIPKKLKDFEPLEYRIPKFYDEKRFRQYRYVDVQDIQILLSPANRLDDLGDRYKKASPLRDYLDTRNEENVEKHATFLYMLKNIDIKDIEKIEKEQEVLRETIPFKVKFNGNYLWQVYYSEATNKYFMIVPTQDTDYSTFFYLLKKQLEGKKGEKIFIPICNAKYSDTYLKRQEFEEIENYLWLFTKDWPLIYEVYDKKGELAIHIVGETNVYEKIKTLYKVELKTKDQAIDFYKLLKALYILQVEVPNHFTFDTNIDEKGMLGFYLYEQKIEYKNMVEFIREQYKIGIKTRKELKNKIKAYNKMLKQLKEIVASQEIEYLAKEKQISTFLECKKSFFGKVKYFFKYSKKSIRKEKLEEIDVEEEYIENDDFIGNKKEKKKIPMKRIYTLEELIVNYKELEETETTMKNLLMDINALKLKTKNMAKKIENASRYIEEIDKHKKSIFEFWKYSNKDEMATLPEGEEEEVNVIKRIEKVFDYNEDLEKLGQKLDRMQRKNLTEEELDSVYVTTTELIDILNEIRTNDITLDNLELELNEIKKKMMTDRALKDEEYDIFGNAIDSGIQVRKINNKRHRELPRNLYEILDVNANTKKIKYKLTLQSIVQNISDALDKCVIPEDVPLYKAIPKGVLNTNDFNVFNINPEDEMKQMDKKTITKINLYKVMYKEGMNGIGFTNIVFYGNINKTLPVGMDLSTKMLIKIDESQLKLENQKSFKIIGTENSEKDFIEPSIKDVNVFEYLIEENQEEQEDEETE